MHIVGVALYVHMGMMSEWGMDIDAIINKSNTKGMLHVGVTFFMHMGMMGELEWMQAWKVASLELVEMLWEEHVQLLEWTFPHPSIWGE
jgi:hypothetical protein